MNESQHGVLIRFVAHACVCIFVPCCPLRVEVSQCITPFLSQEKLVVSKGELLLCYYELLYYL